MYSIKKDYQHFYQLVSSTLKCPRETHSAFSTKHLITQEKFNILIGKFICTAPFNNRHWASSQKTKRQNTKEMWADIKRHKEDLKNKIHLKKLKSYKTIKKEITVQLEL